MATSLYKSYYHSPCGLMEICSNEQGITSLLFVKHNTGKVKAHHLISDCAMQLDEYFNKKRKEFSVSMDLQGTEFQKGVWQELRNIPFGKTISYLQLAIKLGDKKCIRAAGTANGRNPVCILVPCHRVIGSDGSLVGYGGGLDKKKYLLMHEGALVQNELFS